jgi:hypothetical protein
MKLKVLLTSTLLLVVFVGCSSKTETAKAPEPAKTEDSSSKAPETKGASTVPPVATPTATATVSASTPPEVAVTPPPVETPKSPYDGLSAEQISRYETFEKLFEPVVSGGTNAYSALKEQERLAKAVMRFGEFKISLNQDAEKRLRATLKQITALDTLLKEYADGLRSTWGTERPPLPNSQRALLTEAYEKALDEGAEVSPESRRTLGEMARSEGPGILQVQTSLTGLVNDLRPKLLEQSVTGDNIYVFAYWLRQQGEYVSASRAWTRKYANLLLALPPKARTELLTKLVWSPDKELQVDKARLAIRDKIRPFSRTLMDGSEHPSNKLSNPEKSAAEAKKAFETIERERRDAFENYLQIHDVRAWELLLSYDKILAEFQKILDAVVPDLTYRFRPLLPPDAPRGVDENTVGKMPFPGTISDRVPTIEVVDGKVVFDSPAGFPKYKEFVKPGQVLVGTVRLEIGVVGAIDVLTYEDVQLTIKSCNARGYLSCECRIPKHPVDGTEKVFTIGGTSEFNQFNLRGQWPIFGVENEMAESNVTNYFVFRGITDKGYLAGTMIPTEMDAKGDFQFDIKK